MGVCEFVKKIEDLRMKKGMMAQADLAEALGVTQASISRWEKNQLSITGLNIIGLAKFFEVSADDLLGIERKDYTE